MRKNVALIKAELSYNRIFLASLYLATIGMWVIYLFDPAGMFQLFGIPALLLMIALFTRANKEKRQRFHTLLPVSIKQRGLAGLLSYAALFYIGILSGWVTQFLRADLANEFVTFWGVLTLNGLAISICFLIVIHSDLQKYSNKKYLWIADVILAATSLMTISFIFLAKYEFIRNLVFYSPIVAVATNVVCAGLMRLSMAVYAGRKSYLT